MKNAWVSGLQILFGLLLAAGVAAVGLGFGSLADSYRLLGDAVGIGGIALITGVFIWLPVYGRREQESAKQSALRRGEQTAERILLRGESFQVREGSLLPLAIVLTLAAGIAGYSDFRAPSIGAHVSGGLVVLGALYAWLSSIPRMRAPLMRFERDGVHTGPYGFLRWEAVEDMNLIRDADQALTYTLELRVPRADELLVQVDAGRQSFRSSSCGLSGNTLRFSVPAEDAHELHRLALTLWQRGSGRN